MIWASGKPHSQSLPERPAAPGNRVNRLSDMSWLSYPPAMAFVPVLRT
jgi:hypothetical protein